MTTDSNTDPVSAIEGLKAFAKFYCRNAPWSVGQHGSMYNAVVEPKKGCRISYSAIRSTKKSTSAITCQIAVQTPNGKLPRDYSLPLTLYSGEEADKLFDDIQEQCSTSIAINILDQINTKKE